MMRTQEVIEMATESFYEDMVIDTPEKAAAIEELFAHPEKYTYHCKGIDRYQWADEEFLQRLKEKYCRQSDGSQGQGDRVRAHALRFSAGYIS